MLVPMCARLILIFALFLVSSVLSEQTIISSSDTNANNEFLCPSFAGVTVANATHLSSANFSETYIQSETNLRTCNFSNCLESSHRLSCNLAYTNAGLKDINVDKHFPFLSYNRRAAVSTRPKSLSSHSSKKLSIAYVFLVHEQFNQTTRLIKAVYDPNNVYILHVDSKAADLKEELINFANDFHNVYVLEKSFNIRWGGIEMVYSTLEGIFAALDIDAKWDFVINLSSKDYPLCSDADLSAYLATRKGKNFDIADLPDPMGEKFWRARAMYVWCEISQCYQFRERQLPFNVDSYVGSQWFVYSREFAQYLRADSFPRLMLAHYEHTWIPDEGYFGTVLLNSPFKDTRIKNNLRYIVFDQIHPYYWTDDDFPLLESKTDSCFTRKFEWNATVFNLIDTLIGSGPRKLSLP